MFKSLKITCDEATTICDKGQYGESTLLEKIKLSIHFITCKICKRYTKQNKTLQGIYKGYANSCKEQKLCMSKEDKDALKRQLEQINK